MVSCIESVEIHKHPDAGDGEILLPIWEVDDGKADFIPFLIKLSCRFAVKVYIH